MPNHTEHEPDKTALKNLPHGTLFIEPSSGLQFIVEKHGEEHTVIARAVDMCFFLITTDNIEGAHRYGQGDPFRFSEDLEVEYEGGESLGVFAPPKHGTAMDLASKLRQYESAVVDLYDSAQATRDPAQRRADPEELSKLFELLTRRIVQLINENPPGDWGGDVVPRQVNEVMSSICHLVDLKQHFFMTEDTEDNPDDPL